MAKIPLPHPPETTKLRKIQYHHFTKTSKNYWHNKNSAPFYKDFEKFLTQQEYTNTNNKTTIWAVQACWHHTNRQTSPIWQGKMQKFSSCLQEMVLMFSSNPHICIQIDLFTDMVARFKEYYGMPRGHSLSIYTRFSGKKRTAMHISREKGDHYYIWTQHNDLFFPFNTTFF